MCTGGAAPPTVAASPSVDSAQSLRMLELTRRRSVKNRQECWPVFYGDVQVGTIARRTGNPHDTDPWEWLCGFYPGCDPGQAADGCAETFEEAKAQFEEVWNRLRPTRTEAHFEMFRRPRDFTAWKYRLHEKGLKLPTQMQKARCFCGEEITNRSMDLHIQRAHRA
jgi:hypothetical protein